VVSPFFSSYNYLYNKLIYCRWNMLVYSIFPQEIDV